MEAGKGKERDSRLEPLKERQEHFDVGAGFSFEAAAPFLNHPAGKGGAMFISPG